MLNFLKNRFEQLIILCRNTYLFFIRIILNIFVYIYSVFLGFYVQTIDWFKGITKASVIIFVPVSFVIGCFNFIVKLMYSTWLLMGSYFLVPIFNSTTAFFSRYNRYKVLIYFSLVCFLGGLFVVRLKMNRIAKNVCMLHGTSVVANTSDLATKVGIRLLLNQAVYREYNELDLDTVVSFSFEPRAECVDLLEKFEFPIRCIIREKEQVSVENYPSVTNLGFAVKLHVVLERLLEVYPLEVYKMRLLLMNKHLYPQESNFFTNHEMFHVSQSCLKMLNVIHTNVFSGIYSLGPEFSSSSQTMAFPATEFVVFTQNNANWSMLLAWIMFLLSSVSILVLGMQVQKWQLLYGIFQGLWLLIFLIPHLIFSNHSLKLWDALGFWQGALLLFYLIFYLLTAALPKTNFVNYLPEISFIGIVGNFLFLFWL